MPEENLNESMEELCLRLQMEDIQQYHPASKGKQREGIISDFELAMSLYKNELQARLNFQSDERMAKSIARALQGDSEALQVIIDQEAIAGNDRNIAQALQGNENPHIPIRDVVHSNQKTKPKVSRVQQSLEENLRRIALAQDYHVSNVSQDFSLLKVDHRISNAESSRTAASRVTKSSVNEHDILATSEIGRRSCTACTEEIILFDLANLPCEHDYCRDCITRLFSDCMVDESLFPPRCCRINIVPEHVKMFLDPSVVEQFDQKSDELATANRTYCHIQACGAFIPNKTIENDTGICGSCNEATCYICKGPSHRGTDCPQDEALESFLWTAARLGYQRCYSCRRMVELETGCNHMRCPCGAQFCYNCAKKWHTCTCELWTEDRLLSRAQVLRAREEGEDNALPRHIGNNAIIPAARAEATAQQLAAIVEMLRMNHRCNHTVWRRVSGRQRCEECTEVLHVFIFECQQCRLRACRRCKLNRVWEDVED